MRGYAVLIKPFVYSFGFFYLTLFNNQYYFFSFTEKKQR